MRRPLQCAAAGTALLFVTSFQLGPAARVPPKRLPSLSTAAAAVAATTCDSGFELFTAPLQRDDDGKIELKGCSFTELQCIMVSLGQRPERATDFFR
eukprot:19353-Heterococcus_DN1.PRE.3